MAHTRFYVVSYRGDRFAGASLAEAIEACQPYARTVGYWSTIMATDPGLARLGIGRNPSPWIEFQTDRDGHVEGRQG